MNLVKKIEKSSYQDIIDNISYYTEEFLNNHILAFKKLNISIEQQETLMLSLAKELNWGFVSCHDIEDHNMTASKYDREYNSEELFIPWHLEHVRSSNPNIASSWNMLNFTCPSKSGSTGFVDCIQIYDDLTEEYKHFLSKCLVVDSEHEFLPRKPVIQHPNTGENILRLRPEGMEELYYFNDRPADDSEKKYFSIISKWFTEEVFNNEKRQKWWFWDQGDILFPDLLVMAHAVRGGFKIEERSFSRFWAFEKNPSEYFYSFIK
jgi:alpha-ketoglutarate-dependent taurine dioxygenase